MLISHRWLQSIAPTIAGTPEELAERLALLGAPVDEIVQLGAELADVVIARVLEVRPHPNADRLRLCTVEAGGAERLQVVCGAPNVEAGGVYPFAAVGAKLPGGVAIRRAKIRGEVSEGMLCSAHELGLGRDHEGILALRGEWEPGTGFVAALRLDDARLDVDVTANRPDLLSHLGVARELAPGGQADLRLPAVPGAAAPAEPVRPAGSEGSTAGVEITIEDAEGCPSYLAAVVRGVEVGPSPEWLAARLRAVGVRPINNVVDATNYVLHELGQPLHAFDLDRLAGGEIRVRRARPGERIRTLDGVERKLDEADVVIADAERPVAVAGVMGGEESEVTPETRNLLLECALFDRRAVRATRRRLGLSTDASYRFERGVDPTGLTAALQRLLEVLLAVAGGELADAPVACTALRLPRVTLVLRRERVNRLLGTELEAEEIRRLLAPIGFAVEGEGDLRVEVPGFRPDVTREIDLIEEVARRRGYDSFAEELRPFRPGSVPTSPRHAVIEALRALFLRWGFLEARTVAFAPAHPDRIPLENPLSAEESHLRDALLPSLLRRLEHNWARGARDVRLWEVASVFLPGDPPREELRLAAVFTGGRRPVGWQGERVSWDVWDAKALLAELAETLGLAGPVPAQNGWEGVPLEASALLQVGDEGVGGRVAAAALDAPAWAEPVWGVELRLPQRMPAPVVGFEPIPEHPGAERDLALLVPEGVSAAELAEAMGSAGGPLLREAFPFDRYSGEGIPPGTSSLAWRLRFQAADRTLRDAEVEKAVQRILANLEERYRVRRR
jgi:phenylalanyl-tRNA synthetase beta chain